MSGLQGWERAIDTQSVQSHQPHNTNSQKETENKKQ